jgi:hypothetical protein
MQNTKPLKRAPWPGEERTRANEIRQRGNKLALEGDFKGAQECLEQSQALFLELGDVEWVPVGLGQMLTAKNEYGVWQLNSEAELLRLREIARLKAADSSDVEPKFEPAAELYLEALDCSVRLLGAEHPMTGIVTGNLGLCFKEGNVDSLASANLSDAIGILSKAEPEGVYTRDLIREAIDAFENALSLT